VFFTFLSRAAATTAAAAHGTEHQASVLLDAEKERERRAQDEWPSITSLDKFMPPLPPPQRLN
jgi:hypothetical protein